MKLELERLALHLNQQLNSNAEPCRILHGRGGCYPDFSFLNVDCFGVLAVVMLHEPRPLEWGAELAAELLKHSEFEGVVVQDRSISPSNQICYGQVPEQLEIQGEGLKYLLTPGQIKNPGWFLDMREGRKWVAEHAENARVLNLFAYTCGFSLMALKHGAELVVNMDMNKGVLNRGKKNHALNGLDSKKVKYFDHNVMKSFGKIKKHGPYDMVVIDPPSIQTGSFQLRRDYPKLMSRLADWIKPNAKALLCCNDPLIDASEFEAWMYENITLKFELQRLEQPLDFPEKNLNRALKVYRVKFP